MSNPFRAAHHVTSRNLKDLKGQVKKLRAVIGRLKDKKPTTPEYLNILNKCQTLLKHLLSTQERYELFAEDLERIAKL